VKYSTYYGSRWAGAGVDGAAKTVTLANAAVKMMDFMFVVSLWNESRSGIFKRVNNGR
jgi:hypothetical protein